MLVDSHCHLDQLDLTQYEGSLDKALEDAKAHDVEHMLCVCIDMDNFPKVIEIAENYDNVTASVGVHPNVTDSHEPTLEELIKLAEHPKIVAIGETGLDYYRSQGNLDWQRERFRRHIHAAKATNNALIIHSRQAPEDTLKIMREEMLQDIKGVMHCFCED